MSSHRQGVTKRMKPHPFRNVSALPGRSLITWLDADQNAMSVPADAGARAIEFYSAGITRQPSKYPHRKHYEGRYWCAATGTHVWHESMAEYYSLMWLDHQRDLKKISAQPMHIIFDDGTAHYPDFFALLADGSRVMYDVRPLARINEAVAATFAKTERLCAQIGWDYEVLTGLGTVELHNLEVISGSRHPRYRPDAETAERILEFLTEPRSLLDTTRRLDLRGQAAHIHTLYNLMWQRRIIFDTTIPLNTTTTLWSN